MSAAPRSCRRHYQEGNFVACAGTEQWAEELVAEAPDRVPEGAPVHRVEVHLVDGDEAKRASVRTAQECAAEAGFLRQLLGGRSAR